MFPYLFPWIKFHLMTPVRLYCLIIANLMLLLMCWFLLGIYSNILVVPFVYVGVNWMWVTTSIRLSYWACMAPLLGSRCQQLLMPGMVCCCSFFMESETGHILEKQTKTNKKASRCMPKASRWKQIASHPKNIAICYLLHSNINRPDHISRYVSFCWHMHQSIKLGWEQFCFHYSNILPNIPCF